MPKWIHNRSLQHALDGPRPGRFVLMRFHRTMIRRPGLQGRGMHRDRIIHEKLDSHRGKSRRRGPERSVVRLFMGQEEFCPLNREPGHRNFAQMPEKFRAKRFLVKRDGSAAIVHGQHGRDLSHAIQYGLGLLPVQWYSNGVMGIPTLLRKVFLIDLLQGLKVTFRYQDPKEIYTEQYPLERPQVAERYRGAPRLNMNPDTDETMCIACDLCALACPENLIVVSSERNEKTRRKELTNFTYDLSRCMFCGLCEDACPTDALELTQDFELASYDRQGWIWDRETLEKGPQPTQYKR
jgi:NADH-quinone oxidoreductase subunit I